MSLPFPFLAGLLVVVGHRELGGVLPGEGVVDDLIWTACLLLSPWALASVARAAVQRSLTTARPPALPPVALLRLSALATPLALHVLFALGCYGDWIDRLAPESCALRTVLALFPLYLAELPRLTAASMAEALLEVRYQQRSEYAVMPALLPQPRDVWPTVRLRMGWPLLALLPAVLFGVGVDLLALWRPAYVFVMVTAAGLSLGAMAFLLVTAALLPFWFRVAFGVRRGIPEPAGSALRETAERLGFSTRRLFVLPTGMRAVNAMMVGPLPTGRLLCFTDGLLEALDPRSLAGVLAHEVGHARMGHPGLLTMLGFVVPVMLLSPLRWLDPEGGDPLVLAAFTLAGLFVVWLGIRALARRFEFEADIASVQVLGAEPCTRALMTVVRKTLPAEGKLRSWLGSLHPDERARMETMRRYELEPDFRQRFDRATGRVRAGLFATVAVAFVFGAWSWVADWPREQVFVRFYNGDFVGARRSLEDLGDLPASLQEATRRVRLQLDAADELAPGLQDWESVEAALVPAARLRGEQVLLAAGPAAAYPWMALAITVTPSPATVDYAIYEFCAAAAGQDPDLMSRAARAVLRLGVPPALLEVFAGYQ